MKYKGELLNKWPPGNPYKIVPDRRDARNDASPTPHQNALEHAGAQTFADETHERKPRVRQRVEDFRRTEADYQLQICGDARNQRAAAAEEGKEGGREGAE